MKQITLFFLLSFFTLSVGAQTKVNINLNHIYEGSNFTLGQVIETSYYNYKITRFQYYISNFTIIHDGGLETMVNDSYLLIDADNGSYTLGDVNGITSVEKIKFSFGVDDVANHEDPALLDSSHPLAYKTPSMHWGWSGGYMFAVVEGIVDLDKDGVFDEWFDLMPVGDDYYRLISLPTDDAIISGVLDIMIDVNIDKWMMDIAVDKMGFNHGVTSYNLSFVDNIKTFQVFSTSTWVSVVSQNKFGNSFIVLNNGSDPEIKFNDWNNYSLEIFSVEGKLMARSFYIKGGVALKRYSLPNGNYIAHITDNKGNVYSEKITIKK